MSDVENKIKELSIKIHSLQFRQREMENAILILQQDLEQLQQIYSFQDNTPVEKKITPTPLPILPNTPKISFPPKVSKPSVAPPSPYAGTHRKLEDFIGTNLISKVGILITIIGIFIGSKYAIDKNLISPVARIILGYIAGTGLVIIAFRLKNKFENFSAVIMGGGLAVYYFMTYIAFNFYHLLPQGLSFLLLVMVTAATVLIGLWYDKIIISILGQVTAYAIPFLLSNGSGNVLVLFAYMSIINIGLVFLSVRKNWKMLYRVAFITTWAVYIFWLEQMDPGFKQVPIVLYFLVFNFLTFYVTFLAYKMIKGELYNVGEIGILLLNALLFFFAGMYLIRTCFSNAHLQTFFTLLNALIHFFIGGMVIRKRLADNSVHLFINGLGLLFITLAIPVELEGSWITLLWAFEASILFWIAIKNNSRLYYQLTIPLILIATLSLCQDWTLFYFNNNEQVNPHKFVIPFLHQSFWISLIVSGCFGYISLNAYRWMKDTGGIIKFIFKEFLPIIFIFSFYFTILNEIGFTWDQIIHKNLGEATDPRIYFKELSELVFSILYVSLLLRVNVIYLKSKSASRLLLVTAIICLIAFLLGGLTDLGELRSEYLRLSNKGTSSSKWLLIIRYVCFLSIGLLTVSCKNSVKKISNDLVTIIIFSLLFNLAFLSIICNEYIHWLGLFRSDGQYKLGISIICGVYSLALIFYGIKSASIHLRIAGIALFGLTLMKLFFYDLVSMSTISKTIVLVILGILLLMISYLYNKYKAVILNPEHPNKK